MIAPELLAALPVIPWWLMVIALVICCLTFTMTLINLRVLRPLAFGRRARDATIANAASDSLPSLGVCIPARNEEANLEACVRAILDDGYPNLAVYVYDDQSSDRTPAILDALIAADARVHRVSTRPLPSGWVGKQFACDQLGRFASADVLLFIDADVRVEPGDGSVLEACVSAMQDSRVDLVSTFPRQVTGTLAEALIVPLIHFILCSYLPFGRMRTTTDPSACAACGQFIMVRREAYLAAGGHGAFRNSMHDGVKMPRAFRRAGFRTDLIDATERVRCRMYAGLVQTWRGFAKNAYEGLGSPVLLVILTIMHLIGHVLPFVAVPLLVLAPAQSAPAHVPLVLALVACILAIAQRIMLAVRFRQRLIGAILHPVGVLLMTAIQWHSFVLSLTGRRGWRGRVLSPSAAGVSA